ncbi:DHA2 family efflux MFS transporter permease subunit [Curvibacter sp. APW13]|uniref:DHA2 family efflux MFS transporter permease subunit n=1 Tax=Curvibacter sp. APW13 TaxID=3077236 RepID=UPI0028DD427E|nr:DHA2 family efflux MFS transporter permease subunit [Curvibacter sp. APW13]MDT8992318.1 DHA2 family efflux MFS transporter permease subunit [Curvibacter sp. APW13]
MSTSAHINYPPLQGSARMWGTIALSAATFMNVLDSSIANVSLPAIAGDLGVSPNQGTWVITSFGVANAISLPLTGWLSQRFGQVRLFVMSVLLFVLTSWLCGLAVNMNMLIAMRAAQGFVAGPMMPLAQSLLLSSYPPAMAGMAMAMWAMTTLVAPVMGPLLGGWITDHTHWGWIFFINIPVGLVAAGITWTIFHKRESATRKLPIDSIGLALLVVWVGAMQIMLDRGKELDWFHSGEVIVLCIVAVIGLAFFLVWELTDEHPVVDLRLFTGRNFWTGTVAMSVAYSLFMGNLVLLPLWLQQFMGYTSTQAGMLMAPVGLFAILLSPIVGKNVQKFDPRALTSFAFVVFALVLFMRSHFNTMADFGTIMVPTIVQGVAVAFFFIPLSVITLGGLAPQRIPSASGVSSFARMVGGSFGTSIAITVWQDRAAMHHAQLAEYVNQGSSAATSALAGLTASGMGTEQALSQINRMLDQQAYMLAANDVFFASSLIFLCLIPLVWLSRPARPTTKAPSADSGSAADAAAGAH